ncbi:hypothetical protein MSG28_009386 [Choristoneura fumiferana]|uniref:Uncharacterized protein n=1 Tax=Choristoneura fumiferana TaxID=7141 RepID=A0ACC0KXP9_CHOFU|nr:hypothetical protein MSG28_009386 [Choristoneura fumiferana]
MLLLDSTAAGVFNTYHTLALLTLTTYIGITTHGFDHFDSDRPREVSDQMPDIETIERPFLNQVGILLMVVLCANIAWLMKSPGPIRVYIGFATVRLLLSLAGFVYLVMTASASLAAYFILVYYIYAIHLEREIETREPEPAADVSFVYPVKIDKEKLVL